MYLIQQTEVFAEWLKHLKDSVAKAAINRRLKQATQGNLGDIQTIEGSLFEMRIFVGPGYRVYFVQRNGALILLLCGGHKSSQTRDIQRAKVMLQSMT